MTVTPPLVSYWSGLWKYLRLICSIPWMAGPSRGRLVEKRPLDEKRNKIIKPPVALIQPFYCKMTWLTENLHKKDPLSVYAYFHNVTQALFTYWSLARIRKRVEADEILAVNHQMSLFCVVESLKTFAHFPAQSDEPCWKLHKASTAHPYFDEL